MLLKWGAPAKLAGEAGGRSWGAKLGGEAGGRSLLLKRIERMEWYSEFY